MLIDTLGIGSARRRARSSTGRPGTVDHDLEVFPDPAAVAARTAGYVAGWPAPRWRRPAVELGSQRGQTPWAMFRALAAADMPGTRAAVPGGRTGGPRPCRAGCRTRASGRRPGVTGTDAVRLLLADVDGTLVTPDKVLTDRAVDAVRRLGEAGILFAITSGRPPRGMSMLIEPLDIKTPIAAFNGGLLVNRDMSVVEQRVGPAELVGPVADLFVSFRLDTCGYRGPDRYVPDPQGSHVAP